MSYIEDNKKAYNMLAKEYDERKHEIGDEFWINIYDNLNLKSKENYNILEIGPGNGRNIGILQRYNEKFNITTIELSEKLCEIIKKKYPKVHVINDNILDFKQQGKKFDFIIAIALIHLFPYEDAKKVMKLIKNILIDDGHLLIGTTMNKEESEGYYEKEDYSGKIKRFRHKYTKESFEKLLKESGFKIVKPYIIEEKDREKTWYDIVVKKDI